MYNFEKVMKAYLDYNIIVGINKDDYTLENIINIVDKNITKLPYSAAHIEEIDNIISNSEQQ